MAVASTSSFKLAETFPVQNLEPSRESEMAIFNRLSGGPPKTLKPQQLLRRGIAFGCLTLAWISLVIHLAKGLPSIYIPHNLDDVKTLSVALKEYASNQSLDMFLLFVAVFLFKQTYSIPGAALLNILAGSMYGTVLGLVLVLTLTATGSTFTYLLSKHFLGSILFGRIIPESTLAVLRKRVHANRDNLMLFMISIRCIPLVPGGVVNLSAPYVKVPIEVFFVSTFIGVAPYGFICVSAASTLSSLNSVSDIFSFWVVLKLVFIMLLVIIPLVFKNRILAVFNRSGSPSSSQGEDDSQLLQGVEIV
ncbi:Transmembrane protein 41A [Kappamyces sp. JEL0829]|nr:Transmembrane protein 41A [Kappamyces sp. JEL0829]